MGERMFKQEVQNQIQSHYDELVKLGFNVVGVFLYGSQNYELDYEGSDVDSKAIVLPTLEDIILNKPATSKTLSMSNGGQCDVKDIREMFRCFRKQNPNFIEILFTPYTCINPLYSEGIMQILENAEVIARYDIFASLNCMAGMALEKLKALSHPYPTTAWKIEKWGYDPKQLHHILRMKDFIVRYCAGEEYKKILIPTAKDYLLKVKTAEILYSAEEAYRIAKESSDFIKAYKDEYMKSHSHEINIEAENILYEVMTKLITQSIKSEVLKDV